MWEKFRYWYIDNYTEITWFLIGFLTMAGFADLANRDYTGAAISFGLAAVNFMLRNR